MCTYMLGIFTTRHTCEHASHANKIHSEVLFTSKDSICVLLMELIACMKYMAVKYNKYKEK